MKQILGKGNRKYLKLSYSVKLFWDWDLKVKKPNKLDYLKNDPHIQSQGFKKPSVNKTLGIMGNYEVRQGQ